MYFYFPLGAVPLYDLVGNRKYLTQGERRAFELAARNCERETRTFCMMLLYSGCRITEALNLVTRNIDLANKSAIFWTLKRRNGKIVYRPVPLPDPFLDELNLVHDFRRKKDNEKLWTWSRANASRKVGEVMEAAGIKGVHACPKGLRHGFVITCLEKQIPLNMAQKWLRHSSITTTAIYANAFGLEERNIAARLWK